MTALIVAVLAVFSIPFVVLTVAAVLVWLHDRTECRRARRLARELDDTLDRILAGRDGVRPPEWREWRIG